MIFRFKTSGCYFFSMKYRILNMPVFDRACIWVTKKPWTKKKNSPLGGWKKYQSYLWKWKNGLFSTSCHRHWGETEKFLSGLNITLTYHLSLCTKVFQKFHPLYFFYPFKNLKNPKKRQKSRFWVPISPKGQEKKNFPKY